MDISAYVDDVRAQLKSLTALTESLSQAIVDSAGFAYYNQGGEEEGSPSRCVERIVQYMKQWDYPDTLPEDGGSRRPQVVGCVAVSDEALAIADALNAQKAQWKALHEEIRAEAAKDAGLADNNDSAEVWATKQMRAILSYAGHPNLDLDASDRRIPVLPGPAYRINFHHAKSAPSASRQISDVITALEALVGKADDTTSDRARDEIKRLAHFDLDTPVAYRAKRAVASVRYRASFTLGGVKQPAIVNYASNPVLYPHGGPVPRLVVFKKSHTITGAGRPSSVSNERVCSLLPEYFWYKKETVTTQASVAPATTRNPFAKTEYPGLWLGVRPLKNALSPMVFTKTDERRITSVSIKRLGLAKAWRAAAEKYCDYTAIPLDDVLKAMPESDQVDLLLQWAETHAPVTKPKQDTRL